MLIPSSDDRDPFDDASLSRRVNANSQPLLLLCMFFIKLIKKGEC